MAYYDIFAVPLSPEKREPYTEMASLFGTVVMEHGALKYVEAIADNVPEGKQTDWFRAVDRKDGETVVTSFVIWPDKATRDTAHGAMMKDPRFANMEEESKAIFDGKRMIWGGFSPLVEL